MAKFGFPKNSVGIRETYTYDVVVSRERFPPLVFKATDTLERLMDFASLQNILVAYGYSLTPAGSLCGSLGILKDDVLYFSHNIYHLW